VARADVCVAIQRLSQRGLRSATSFCAHASSKGAA
jgi:hypothetical protein